MGSKVHVANIQPYTSIGFSVIIPPNTSLYTQNFNQVITFPDDDYVYISRIIARIDTTGFWNIPTNESFLLNGVPTTIAAGNYSDSDLQTIAQVTIQQGPNNYLVKNNQSLQFPQPAPLQYVLGYNSFGTSLIPPNTLSTSTIASTGDLDMLFIANDIVNISSPLGTNYITAISANLPVAATGGTNVGGAVEYDSGSIHYPLTKRSFNSINWLLNTAYGKPYLIQTPIVIFTQISSQKK